MANHNVMHFFSVDDAKNYGINAAIILQNIRHWVYENQARGHNFHDGKFWTFNSVSAFCNIFDYMTEKQIRGALDQLEEDGILVSGNYNKHGFDKTKWYTLSEKCLSNPHYDSFALQGKRSALQGERFAPEGERFAPEGEPIPYINNNINNKEKDIVENSANLSTGRSKKIKNDSSTIKTLTEAQVSLLKETYDYFNQKVGQSLSYTSAHNQSLIKRIKEGKTFEMFKIIIDSKYSEWSCNPEMVHNLNPTTLFRDKHFDLYYETGKTPIVAKSTQPNIGAEPMDEKVRAQMEKDDENYFFQQNKCSNYHLERHPVKSEKTGEIYEVTFLKQDTDNVYLTPLNGDKVIKMALEELKYKEYKKKVTILYDKKVEDFFDEEKLTDYKSRFSELFKLKS